jgi:hypothetical protein
MSESATASVTTPPAQPSFWENLIDIFFAPAGVFRRWQHRSAWPPMLFVAIAIGVIVALTFNVLEPVIDAEMVRGVAQSMKARGLPAPTAEQLAMTRKFGIPVAQYGSAIIILFTMFIVGTVSWLVGMLFKAKQTYNAALVVAAWAYMPRVLGTVANGIQGLLMDTSQMKTVQALSLGPVRFFDPDTTNPLLFQVLARLDLMILWETALLAIGLYVTGKVSKSNAWIFGFTIWFLGGLLQFRSGYLAM